MNQESKLLGYYNYTVILTYMGMLTGFVGIIYVFEGNFFGSVICLMLAGLFDMFDGTVAATKERTEMEKCFGIQIDSLSDLICFGVLPGLILYGMNRGNNIILAVSGVYVLCALIRLAYFNVDEQERQKNNTSSRKLYFGLPVTMSALFIPLLYGAGKFFAWRSNSALIASLITMAILFLIPFPIKKPKLIGKISIVLCGICEVIFVAFVGGDV